MKRRILFIHQNFPGQFGHAALALARAGHEVVALGISAREIEGVRTVRYQVQPPAQPAVGLAQDFEVKAFRGMACAQAMDALKQSGFVPDVMVVHPGWGEALFCKDVFPTTRMLVFAEFYYAVEGTDFLFDPEFSKDSLAARARLRLKNSVHLHALEAADGGYSPTEWQHRQIPATFRGKFDVIFDGIDTPMVRPEPGAVVQLQRAGVKLVPGDEVITFVNRNLEPYRGFHTFMRALPEMLRQRPNARVLIVGTDDVSYGSKPAQGGNWRQVMLAEVGAQLPMERVHFLGRVPYADYLRILQISACHVYLTYPFVLSWSCLEAMSAGCLVVGSRTAPVQEVITHGENGWLVDFFDPAALAAQVVEVLATRDQHAAVRELARQTVVARYDLASTCLPRLLDLILASED
jgi:glycosyltransferase involved in cell wall biosynthesis